MASSSVDASVSALLDLKYSAKLRTDILYGEAGPRREEGVDMESGLRLLCTFLVPAECEQCKEYRGVQ